MPEDELHEPLARYRDSLAAAHRANAEAMFDDLAARSGVDPAANARTCARAERLSRDLREWEGRLSRRRAAKAALWTVIVLAVLAALAAAFLGDFRGDWLAAAIVAAAGAAVILYTAVRPALGRAAARIASLRETLAAAEAEADAQMAPLNALFDWDMPGKLAEQTLPAIHFDPYFSEGRLRDLRETFGWRGEGFGSSSVLWAQSGEINGNPFVIGRVVEHKEGTRVYEGTRRITWQVRVPDGNGGHRWETRSETLRATVEKPVPLFPERSFVLFANDAAERLAFTRAPSPMASETPGTRACDHALKRAVKKLEKFSRNLDDSYGFTMSDPEFEAWFQAWDRNDEIQFRLLYTPIAQRQILALLKDREVGFGDDFEMAKRGRLNLLRPRHLDNACLDGNPDRWRSRDFRKTRAAFVEGNVSWFRHAYFALAPLLAVPLYRQLRSHDSIWQTSPDRASAAPENESLANYLGESRFRHPASATRNILKAASRRAPGGDGQVEITAHGFRTEERTEEVSVLGGDGRRHTVTVPWLEYFPVSRITPLRVLPAPTPAPSDSPSPSLPPDPSLAGLIYRRSLLASPPP